MIRILSSRTNLVDKSGKIMPDWFTFLSDWVKQFNQRTFSGSGTTQAITGTVTATQVVSFNGSPGNTGVVRITVNTSCTSNANAKSVIVKAGGVTISTIAVDANKATQSASLMVTGRAANSQYCAVTSQVNCVGTQASCAADFSGNVEFTIFLQVSNAADTITLESYAFDVESI